MHNQDDMCSCVILNDFARMRTLGWDALLQAAWTEHRKKLNRVSNQVLTRKRLGIH